MTSFVADCPRGHRGCFVTVGDYYVCFCNLRVPHFIGTIVDTKPALTPSSYTQEDLDCARMEAEEDVERRYNQQMLELQDRLKEVAPEHNSNIYRGL